MLLLLLEPLPRSRRCDAAGAARAARPVPQAESSERPLRRRAARMARPARVRMRRRKPWVLARRRLFGWKVRLLTLISVTGRTRVVRECWRGRPASAAIGSPRSRSRACENGRQGLAYGTRAPARGSNQHRFFPWRVRLPAETGTCRATRRPNANFPCSAAPSFRDQVARPTPTLLASPVGAPTEVYPQIVENRVDSPQWRLTTTANHGDDSVARPRRARTEQNFRGVTSGRR